MPSKYGFMPSKSMIAWALGAICFNVWNIDDVTYVDCVETGYIDEEVVKGGFNPTQLAFYILFDVLTSIDIPYGKKKTQ